jgi:4a-hydroxytetrahydrobiopterin dehydratase
MELLEPADLVRELSATDGWTGDVTAITRTVSLSTFPAAIAVVDRIAAAAEEADHHPDIDIRWRTLTLTLSTHAAGNRVTGSDIALAKRIDEIVRASAA